MAERVSVHVYDLSNGMAAQLSQAFLGQRIEGIWHTGIIAFGYEHYFGGGVQKGPPGMTPYGRPVNTVDLGVSRVNAADFEAFLIQMRQKYTAENYSLLHNNCNNFSDEVAKFLTGGTGIPSYITGLPAEVMRTPLGAMIAPLIENMEREARRNAGDSGDVALTLSGALGGGGGVGSIGGQTTPPSGTIVAREAAAEVAAAQAMRPPPAVSTSASAEHSKGSLVWYVSPNDNTRHEAKIQSVHYDEVPPYYTITMADGRERQTVAARLAQREAPSPASAAAAAAQARAHQQQQQQQSNVSSPSPSFMSKADLKAAVAKEFNVIMAEGKLSPNDAAAEALKRVKARNASPSVSPSGNSGGSGGSTAV